MMYNQYFKLRYKLSKHQNILHMFHYLKRILRYIINITSLFLSKFNNQKDINSRLLNQIIRIHQSMSSIEWQSFGKSDKQQHICYKRLKNSKRNQMHMNYTKKVKVRNTYYNLGHSLNMILNIRFMRQNCKLNIDCFEDLYKFYRKQHMSHIGLNIKLSWKQNMQYSY